MYIYICVCMWVDTGEKKWLLEKKKVHPYSPHWKKNLRICTLNFFAAEIPYLYNMCKVLELNYAICMVFKAFWPWILCLHRARSIMEPASVLRRGLSAAFPVICNILCRVSFWIYFRLVRVYLGDQRIRRVNDQDEEGKGPGDQEDPGTRGPRDQRTMGTKGSGEP